jgi:large subunit ribosomal protein L32
MGLPSKRRTKQSKRDRASHFALTPANTRPCPKCKHPTLPHRVCAFCGTYKGRQVVKAQEKKMK